MTNPKPSFLPVQSDMFCSLLNQFLSRLAFTFKHTKFLRSIVDLCIPNFPEHNLPAIFVYRDGQLVKQLLGAAKIGDLNMKCEGKLFEIVCFA
jgi:hypothetical protein